MPSALRVAQHHTCALHQLVDSVDAMRLVVGIFALGVAIGNEKRFLGRSCSPAVQVILMQR